MARHGDNYWLERLGLASASVVTKAITFDGTANKGATGTVPLFTITGQALVAIVAVCSTSLVGATATHRVGNATTTNRYQAQVTATNIVAGDTIDLSGEVSAGTAVGTTPNQAALNSESIIATVGTAAITAGVVTYYCFYRELSKNASVAAA